MSGHDHGQRSDDAIFSDWIGPKGCEAVYDIIISVGATNTPNIEKIFVNDFLKYNALVSVFR